MFDPLRFGTSVALVDDARTWTYEELAHAGESIAQAIGGRTLAFIACTNTVGCIAGYTGMLDAGIAPLMVGADLDMQLLHGLADVYAPTHIWAPTAQADDFPGYRKDFSFESYTLLVSEDPRDAELHDDLALLMSTSGSTGTPKLVRLSAENLLSNARSIVEYLGITADERAITSLPLHYVYGLSVLNTHLLMGASLALTELACYTGSFWKFFKKTGCTSFAGVPFMYEMLDKLKFANKTAPEGLKTMTQAGGKLSPALQEKFTAFAQREGLDFFVMYGASEATARMAYLPPDHAAEKPGSMGIPIPQGRFEIVDVDGSVIDAANTPGELVYYGPNVSLGYALERSDLSKGDENAGRLPTGDIAMRDEDGFYYVVGRLKRFIKMLGKRMNLDDVERLLKEQLDTVDVACAGKDDLLKVFVLDDDLIQPARDVVTGRLDVNPRMLEVFVIDEIPKSSSGKTLYAKLNDMQEVS